MRRSARALAVPVAAAVLLAACGGSSDGGSDGERPTLAHSRPAAQPLPERADADFVVWADADHADAVTTVAAAFGESKGITVAVQTIPDDSLLGFIAANGDGDGPDVVMGSNDWIGTLVQNGAIEPVELTETDQLRYAPVALAGVRQNTTLYGLPYAYESVALYRNTDLVPTAPATLEQLGAAATSSGSEHPLCLPVGPAGDPLHLQPIYSSAGGYLFGTTPAGAQDPTDLGIGKDGSLAAAAKIGELGAQGLLSTAITPENAVPLFTEGRCAFLVAGPSALPEVRQAGVPYAVGPVVGFAGMQPAQPFTQVSAFFVASKGEGREYAQQFVLDAANSPETMTALYSAEPRPPAMTQVLAATAASDPDTQAFADAAAAGRSLPSIPQMAAVWKPFGAAQAAIIAGADPESTMNAAGTTIAAELR